MSASLHSLSGIFYNDYIRPQKWFADTDDNANLTMRVIIVIIGLFCALSGFIIEHFQSVFEIVVTIVGMGTGAIVGAFSLGMLYPWANKKVNTFKCFGNHSTYIVIVSIEHRVFCVECF